MTTITETVLVYAVASVIECCTSTHLDPSSFGSVYLGHIVQLSALSSVSTQIYCSSISHNSDHPSPFIKLPSPRPSSDPLNLSPHFETHSVLLELGNIPLVHSTQVSF